VPKEEHKQCQRKNKISTKERTQAVPKKEHKQCQRKNTSSAKENTVIILSTTLEFVTTKPSDEKFCHTATQTMVTFLIEWQQSTPQEEK
jgi:hypothetical protein